ncbi:MAG: UDP-N-acetylmuramoyl-L-alanyl-D-glutamate--2,6-diaminopimelate ligase [Bacilli bacterium]
MKLNQLLQSLTTYTVQNECDVEIRDITTNSNEVRPGSLFLCLRGYTVDGHNYVPAAIQKGAVAIVSEKPLDVSCPVVIVKDTHRAVARLAAHFYGHPTENLHLVGITGTNGKTSTSHMINHFFRENKKTTGLIGTIQMLVGEEIFEVKNTTPDALTLQRTFQYMLSKNVDTAVMEVSSHALSLGRVHGCAYDVAVFTNLTQDHLDFHGSMERYFQAKSLLFSQMGNSFTEKPRYAIVNVDDAVADALIESTQAHIYTYGIDSTADFRATNMRMTSGGTSFTLTVFEDTFEVTTQLVGKFNVYNLLAAFAAGYASGLSLESMLGSVQTLRAVGGRFELVDAGQPYTVLVDYAHTPDSLKNVLETVKEFAVGKVWCIVGCGGDRDRTKRPLMAGIAARLADQPVFTSDNPRTEEPEAILNDMLTGVESGVCEVIVDRKEAIQQVISRAQPEDVVLIAGKGHETYQIIGKEIFPFDDRKIARAAIAERM